MLKDDVNAPEVSLAITVQPGAQYRIATIRWWGNKAFYSEDLQKQLSVKPGGVADGVQIESDLENVQKLYGSKGYLRASVAANPTFDDADSTVSYEFSLHEGDVYRLHEVEIAGAGLTKDTIGRLRDAWQMREGEPYDAGYEREYIKAVARILSPNVSVKMNRDISDENKTVDVNMNFVVHADKVIREKAN
jgi:outer membrane protein assembly factor BamA